MTLSRPEPYNLYQKAIEKQKTIFYICPVFREGIIMSQRFHLHSAFPIKFGQQQAVSCSVPHRRV
jgi:hypothetical protein